jgi:hypothetical protein
MMFMLEKRDDGEIIIHPDTGRARLRRKKPTISYAPPPAPTKLGEQMTTKQLYDAIEKRAAEIRAPGESPQRAFAKAVTSDPEGRELFAKMKAASLPAPLTRPQEITSTSESYPDAQFRSQEEAELDRLAKELQDASPGLSYAQAFSRVYGMPSNRALVDAIRTQSMVRQMRAMGQIA